jgi:dTDP-4-amino-4,6-dideoxygalactose transaminase
MNTIPFSRPSFAGNELDYVREAISGGYLGTNGTFVRRCEALIAAGTGLPLIHLTTSATAGLELSALALELGPGHEVIMPAFAFVTCAVAVALRGATPVFVDIVPETLNIDPAAVEAAITPRTRAILAIHYAGIPCAIDVLKSLAERRGLILIEDAAQAFMSSLDGRPAGGFGHFGVYSFDHMKNLSSGEGGALVVNDAAYQDRVEIHLNKGTDRRAFDRGERRRFTWVDLGSSFAANNLGAAVLLAQLERTTEITEGRRALWAQYHAELAPLEKAGKVSRPGVPANAVHNGHCYYLLLEDEPARDRFIAAMQSRGITTPFHFLPLDVSPGGRRYAKAGGPLPVTHSAASRLVRLPLWYGMEPVQDRVIEAIFAVLG